MRIILLGPTASGKTELSLQIAEELGIPIISVDSRQCYKHLDIGTAKPSEKELQRVGHYNISNLELDEPDSVLAFSERAEAWEKKILNSSDHSFFVGGSTLHLQSLIRPIEDIPSANEENIAEIESQIDKEGIEPVYNKLKSVDPEYVKTMDGMNRQRIIRALDVWMQTGKPFSSFHSNEEFELFRCLIYDSCGISLTLSKKELVKDSIKLEQLIEALDEHDDVQNVYTNAA